MKKIAVDVKGTLEGPRRAQIIQMIRMLLAQGHDVQIWSFGLGAQGAYRLKAATGIDLEWDDKFSKHDAQEQGRDLFDVAIEDDRSQIYLAAKKFIWVDLIPTEPEKLQALVEGLWSVDEN